MNINENMFDEFKHLIDDLKMDPHAAARDLGLTDDELNDFTTAYWDDKYFKEHYEEIDDSDIDLGGS